MRGRRRPCTRAADRSILTIAGWPKRKFQLVSLLVHSSSLCGWQSSPPQLQILRDHFLPFAIRFRERLQAVAAAVDQLAGLAEVVLCERRADSCLLAFDEACQQLGGDLGVVAKIRFFD